MIMDAKERKELKSKNIGGVFEISAIFCGKFLSGLDIVFFALVAMRVVAEPGDGAF